MASVFDNPLRQYYECYPGCMAWSWIMLTTMAIWNFCLTYYLVVMTTSVSHINKWFHLRNCSVKCNFIQIRHLHSFPSVWHSTTVQPYLVQGIYNFIHTTLTAALVAWLSILCGMVKHSKKSHFYVWLSFIKLQEYELQCCWPLPNNSSATTHFTECICRIPENTQREAKDMNLKSRELK